MSLQDIEHNDDKISDAQVANMMCDFVEFLEIKLGEEIVAELIKEYNQEK